MSFFGSEAARPRLFFRGLLGQAGPILITGGRAASCDPDNRLIAAQLEKNWETALRRVRDLEVRKPADSPSTIEVDPDTFTNLADNLQAAWDSPDVTTRARQQLLRTLIADIVVDVDDAVREVVLTIHWKGGQHSELKVRKPQSCEHGCVTTQDALTVKFPRQTPFLAAHWPWPESSLSIVGDVAPDAFVSSPSPVTDSSTRYIMRLFWPIKRTT